MKKSEFKKLVRPLIKEELYNILGEVLPSLLSEVVAEQIIPQKQSSQQNPHIQTTNQNTKNKSPIQFSKNPLLNEVLTETQGGISDGSEMVSIDGNMPMIGESENPLMSSYEMGHDDHISNDQYSSGEHGQKVNLQELQQVAPGVASALTRDYSSLMKAVDKKRTSSSPSNIDFTKYNG